MSEIYAALAGMLGGVDSDRPKSRMSVLFGTVESAGGGQLKVTCNGMVLDQDGIGVPPELNYQWQVDTGEDHLLRAGDRLICLVSDDNQDYYILKKAVWQ